MNRRLAALAVFMFLGLIGCSNEVMGGMTGSKPPKAFVKIQNDNYEMKLGTYCWDSGGSGICVDTAGPVDLLNGKDPIKVKPGELITFHMDYEPKPNEIHLAQFSENKETEVEVKENRFAAPIKKGIYYYSYGVWWMDEKEKDVSNGDAFYAFVLEVAE